MQSQAEQCESVQEQSRLYKAAYEWLVQEKAVPDQSALRAVFTQLWKSRIHEYLESQVNNGVSYVACKKVACFLKWSPRSNTTIAVESAHKSGYPRPTERKTIEIK